MKIIFANCDHGKGDSICLKEVSLWLKSLQQYIYIMKYIATQFSLTNTCHLIWCCLIHVQVYSVFTIWNNRLKSISVWYCSTHTLHFARLPTAWQPLKDPGQQPDRELPILTQLWTAAQKACKVVHFCFSVVCTTTTPYRSLYATIQFSPKYYNPRTCKVCCENPVVLCSTFKWEVIHA